MPGRPPRHSTDSGPLDPTNLLQDDALDHLEQPELLVGGTPLSSTEPAWRPPLAVTYAEPEGLAAADGASDPDLPYWLAFNRVKGIGPARFALLLGAFGSARAAWEAGTMAWRSAGLDERTTASLARQHARIHPEAELERLVRLRVTALTLTDPAYPKLLREIALPPPVLYVRGQLSPADEWAVAIVGTRRASAYGRQMTERLAGELAAQQITIVSGLARGIDTYADLHPEKGFFLTFGAERCLEIGYGDL
jgi:DNA processing protein